jgi:tRNA (guanine37-N1)-methyltransferase
MSEQVSCMKVNKIYGEKAIVIAKKLRISNQKFKIHVDNNYVCVPLIRSPEKNEIVKLKTQVPDVEITTSYFSKKKQQRKTLAQILENRLSPHLMASLPQALDIIGDIAIIDIPSELKVYERFIGEAILETKKNVRTVLAKISSVSGTYRLRDFVVIAGEPETATIHKEYGCQYHVDVAKAYFSPRLSHEHNRVATLIQKGETVVDLFAGVGPFSVLIAKKNADAKVFSVDINPEAVGFLKRNFSLNRVENRAIPILGDARQVIEQRLQGIADRVIMNLPEKALEFVDSACKAIRPSGGVVHYYSFVRLPNSLEDEQLRFSDVVEKAGRKVDLYLFAKAIRATAPYEWQVVLDAKIL